MVLEPICCFCLEISMAFLFGGFRVTPKQFFNQVFCQGKNALSSPPHPIKKDPPSKQINTTGEL
jgi:hypothetical protein